MHVQVDPCKQKPFFDDHTCKPIAQKRWSFVQKSGTCESFYFTGCGKNDNHFESRKLCEKTCGVPVVDCCAEGFRCCGRTCVKYGIDEPCESSANANGCCYYL